MGSFLVSIWSPKPTHVRAQWSGYAISKLAAGSLWSWQVRARVSQRLKYFKTRKPLPALVRASFAGEHTSPPPRRMRSRVWAGKALSCRARLAKRQGWEIGRGGGREKM